MNRARVSPLGQAVGLAIGLALSFGPTMKASAQWLPDRQYAEGPGIRLGELELHPGIAVRGGYDNNVFRSDGKSREGPDGPIQRDLQGAAILAVTPHIYLSTETGLRRTQGEDQPAPSRRLVEFRGGVAATYFNYFIDNGPRNLAVDSEFFLDIADGRPVGADLTLNYRRTVSPFTENAGERNAYLLDMFDPRFRLKFSSRSKVLTGFIGYSPRYVHYQSDFFRYLNSIQHGIDLGSAWRFLPSTALVYDARFALQSYLNQGSVDELPLLYSDNQSLHTRLGINGAVSNRITLRLLAGYAVGWYDSSHLDEFEDAIGEAVLAYSFGQQHNFEVGYQRDVQSTAVGAWYQTDRGFGKLSLTFARRFLFALEAGAAHANYGRLVRPVPGTGGDEVEGLGVNGDTTRDDIRVDGAARAEYRATNWLAFMVDYTIQSVITDFEYAATVALDPDTGQQRFIPDPAGFTAMQIFGGVRAHY